MTDSPPINKPDRSYVPWYRRCVPSWRAVAIVVVLMLAAPFAVRWYRLSRMPDVPVPFDVDAFCVPAPASEEDSVACFRKAFFLNGSVPQDDDWMSADEITSWPDVPQVWRTRISDHQPVLNMFREGARRQPANPIPPGSYTRATSFWDFNPGMDLERQLSLNSLRLLEEDRVYEAAEVLHDAFRASRHMGYRGRMTERWTGIRCHQYIVERWHDWCRHPQLTMEQLESSLRRIREDWQLTPRVSDNLKVEYLLALQETRPPLIFFYDEFNAHVDQWSQHHLELAAEPTIKKLNKSCPGWQRPILWVIGEPELSRRALRLWLMHELKTCDLPVATQPPRADGRFNLSDKTNVTEGLDTHQLDARLQESMLSVVLLTGNFWRNVRAEAAEQELLEIEMELQILFRRLSARSRADIEKLLNEFSWPIDPCSAEKEPIQFRTASEGLLVWSTGFDGKDQGGQPLTFNKPGDIVITIPWPREMP